MVDHEVSELEKKHLPTHVEKCGERYTAVSDQLTRIYKRLGRLELWIVGGLASAVVYLLSHNHIG